MSGIPEVALKALSSKWNDIVKVVGSQGAWFSFHDQANYLSPIEQAIGCVSGWRDQVKRGEISPFDLWKGRYRAYFVGDAIVVCGCGADELFDTSDDELGIYVDDYSELQRLREVTRRP
jgi:hypothetical protein